jgi:7,8-dihydropterin-6-yl-methyl-4-(beta-D-ribofuranosyl)aminobenzene 5'-phosphate synthase
MATTLTLLVDNLAKTGLKHEHGFALFIEHQDKRILFDSGQSEALFFNAAKLNISLKNLDIIVLSHGHYDHGGNLSTLLLDNPNTVFYAHPDCINKRYSLHPNKPIKTISLSQQTIEKISHFPVEQCHFITEPTQITPGIWLTGEIPRCCPLEDTSGPFFLDVTGKKIDLLKDDMSLWIENIEGVTVICGCCHSGVINTLEHIKKQIGDTKSINTLLGGYHLVNASQHRIEHCIEYLNQQHIEGLYPAHCTGENVMQLLKLKFKNQVQVAKAGLSISIK